MYGRYRIRAAHQNPNGADAWLRMVSRSVETSPTRDGHREPYGNLHLSRIGARASVPERLRRVDLRLRSVSSNDASAGRNATRPHAVERHTQLCAPGEPRRILHTRPGSWKLEGTVVKRSQANLWSRIFRIAGAVVALVSMPTLIMSALKFSYAAVVEIKLLQFVADSIEALYGTLVSHSVALSHWWRLSPEPNPADLYSIQSVYFCSIVILLAVGGFLFSSGQDLARGVHNADRRRRERRWEDYPDE